MSVSVGMLVCERLSQGGWEAEFKRLFSLEFTSRDGCLRAEVIPHTAQHPSTPPRGWKEHCLSAGSLPFRRETCGAGRLG